MSSTASTATTGTPATGDPATVDPATATDPTQGDPAAEQLGDGGKKALDAERNARKAAEGKASELQKQLDAISRANESELERARREATEAQEVAAKATAEALRFKVAAKHGISEEDAALFLTGTDADVLEQQAARLAERNGPTAGPRPDLTQGGSGQSVALNGDPLLNDLKSKLGIA